MKVIDLFSGCGGLSLGFCQNNNDIVAAVEIDSSIAHSYKMNHIDTEMHVNDIKEIDVNKYFRPGDADIIVGGPPCQGFSMAGARIRNGFIDDPRNYLFKHYFNIVRSVKPEFFVMENVKGLMTMYNGTLFAEILRIFSDPDLLDGETYKVNHKLVNAYDLGVPQKRERVLIIGSLNKTYDFEQIWRKTSEDIVACYPNYLEKVTVWDAIGNLPDASPDGLIERSIPKSSYQQYLASENGVITNHLSTRHSKKSVERMKRVKPGENYTVLSERINSVHSGAYGRLSWDEPAATITTRFDTPAGGRFIHPTYHRTLSPREAARLQSFPDDFIFYGNRTSVCKQIGNAVPPKIAYFVARLIENMDTRES